MRTRRLYRSTRESRVAGVCGGIAEHFDVDPVLVRLGVVALFLAVPPLGLLGYAVAWLVMPTEPPPAAVSSASPEPAPSTPASPAEVPATPPAAGFGPPPAEPPPLSTSADPGPPTRPGIPDQRLRGPAFGGMVLILIGLILLMLNLGLFEWGIFRLVRWRYLWPTAMIVLGVWLLVRAVQPASARMERDHGR